MWKVIVVVLLIILIICGGKAVSEYITKGNFATITGEITVTAGQTKHIDIAYPVNFTKINCFVIAGFKLKSGTNYTYGSPINDVFAIQKGILPYMITLGDKITLSLDNSGEYGMQDVPISYKLILIKL